jgi:hypothetical protein
VAAEVKPHDERVFGDGRREPAARHRGDHGHLWQVLVKGLVADRVRPRTGTADEEVDGVILTGGRNIALHLELDVRTLLGQDALLAARQPGVRHHKRLGEVAKLEILAVDVGHVARRDIERIRSEQGVRPLGRPRTEHGQQQRRAQQKPRHDR